MAKDTQIEGYNLGDDGAWVKWSSKSMIWSAELTQRAKSSRVSTKAPNLWFGQLNLLSERSESSFH
jgi:hypothetical protein